MPTENACTGHITHKFRRVPIKYHRERIEKYIHIRLIELLPTIQGTEYLRYTPEEKETALVTKELIGMVLRGNGFFPQQYDLTDASRYFSKEFRLSHNEVTTCQVQIRLSDHFDHTRRHHRGRRLRRTINYLTIDGTDDAVHLAVKRVIQDSMF